MHKPNLNHSKKDMAGSIHWTRTGQHAGLIHHITWPWILTSYFSFLKLPHCMSFSLPPGQDSILNEAVSILNRSTSSVMHCVYHITKALISTIIFKLLFCKQLASSPLFPILQSTINSGISNLTSNLNVDPTCKRTMVPSSFITTTE